MPQADTRLWMVPAAEVGLQLSKSLDRPLPNDFALTTSADYLSMTEKEDLQSQKAAKGIEHSIFRQGTMQTPADGLTATEESVVSQDQSNSQAKTRAHLLGLPCELRDRIYEFLVDDIKYIHTTTNISVFSQDAPATPALLSTCSQLYQEYTDQLPKQKTITVHGDAGNLLRSTSLVPADLASTVVECTVHLSVFLGLGSLAGQIKRHVDNVGAFAQQFPDLERLNVRFASRNLMGYSHTERVSNPSWSLRRAVDEFTTDPRVNEVQVLECNNHVVICRRCRDLYRALNDQPTNGGHCQCRTCKSFHEVWYNVSDVDDTMDTEPRTCDDCGTHNFYQWGNWTKDGGWTSFLKEKYRSGAARRQ